jgi:hypothetical protein
MLDISNPFCVHPEAIGGCNSCDISICTRFSLQFACYSCDGESHSIDAGGCGPEHATLRVQLGIRDRRGEMSEREMDTIPSAVRIDELDAEGPITEYEGHAGLIHVATSERHHIGRTDASDRAEGELTQLQREEIFSLLNQHKRRRARRGLTEINNNARSDVDWIATMGPELAR